MDDIFIDIIDIILSLCLTCLQQFQEKPKLGGDRLAMMFQQKIHDEIEDKFQSFNETNEVKYNSFVVSPLEIVLQLIFQLIIILQFTI